MRFERSLMRGGMRAHCKREIEKEIGAMSDMTDHRIVWREE